MSTPYTGPSIVDYLTSVGQASDYNSRAALAKSKGIANYTGTAEQNTQLLNTIRSSAAPAPTPAPAPSGGNPAPAQTTPGATPSPYSAPYQATLNAGDVSYYRTQIQQGLMTPAEALTALQGKVAKPTGREEDATGAYQAYTNLLNNTKSQLYAPLSGVYQGRQFNLNPDGTQTYTTAFQQNTVVGPNGQTTTTNNNVAPGQAPATQPPQQPIPGQPAPAGAAPVAPGGAPMPTTVAPPANPAGPGARPVSTYTGPSIVDYLTSVGQPSDFNSRAQMAARMGITNYTGTAAQNTQILNSLRAAGGGKDTTTATSGANAGAGATPGSPALSPETQSVIDNAKAIAASFGWTAPDPKNSPLNIASDLFKQGLSAFGLNDLKTEINKILQQRTDLENKQVDDVAEINSNPWLTEGERLTRIQKVGEKYQGKLDVLTHSQQLFETDYKTGLDQVQWQVGQAMSAYTKAQDNNDAIFKEALTIAEKQLEAKNALKTVSAGASVVDAEGNIVSTAPSKPKATPTAKTISDGTLKVTQVDIDDGKHRLDVIRGTDGYVDPYKYLDMAKTWTDKGGTITGFVKQYPPKDYINPDDGDLVPAWASPNPKKGSASLY